MITNEQLRKATENFILASKDFNFEFLSPFNLTDNLTAFAYIDNYGSKNGVVIGLMSPPDYQIDHAVIDWCKKNNCFYSFLDIESLTSDYKRSYFRAMLRDWGKY